MPQIRLILAFLIFVVLSGLIAGGLAGWLNLNFPVTLVVLQSSSAMLIMWLARKYRWWDKVNTSGISDDSLQKILLHALIGVVMMACLPVLLPLIGRDARGAQWITLFINYGVLLWIVTVVMRFIVRKAAARKNPALRDERMQLNVQKSQKWALFTSLSTAAILPFLDQQGWLAFSAAVLGLAVVFAGMIAFLASLLWLEAKDG